MEPPYHLLMLLGSSILVFSVVGEPASVKIALAGYMVWILAVARLLLGGQGAVVAPMAARVQGLLPQLLRPVQSNNLLMPLGASILVLSVVGEPSSVNVALAGYMFWVLGVARLLLGGQGAVVAPMAARVQDLLPQLLRPVPPHHLLMPLGASILALSVVGEPPSVPAVLVGFLLWILGVVHLLLDGQGAVAAPMVVARAQHLPPQHPRPSPPYHLLMLLGALMLVFSFVGESPSVNVALAGYTFWILGTTRLLLGGQGAVLALMAGRVQYLLPQLPRLIPPNHVLMLLGASMLVPSVVAEPPSVHVALAAAGYLLWVLGVARLLLGGQGAAAVERLKRFFFGRQDGPKLALY